MTDEEKKAIKGLTEIKELFEEDLKENYEVTAILDQIDLESLVIALNLIEKQSKEIEHWKAGMKIIEKDKNNHIERLERKIKELDSQNEVLEEIKTSYEKKTDKLLKEKVKKEKEIEELKDTRSIFNMGRRSYKNEIENKIKEILGIEEDIDNEKLLSLLQTIVDENARLEDIEDKKVQIEYNNVFNKGVKSVEDKIKAKIEEYDDKGMTVNLANRSAGKTFQQAVHYEIKKVLQSLLEKEFSTTITKEELEKRWKE